MVNSRPTVGSLDLRQGPIPALIRKIAVPASTGMVFSTLLNVTDTRYAGMLSPTALAALSLAAPVSFLVVTFGIGMGQASNALVGNELGRDKLQRARALALQAIGFAALVSLTGAGLALLGTPLLFRLMGGEAPYLQPAIAYMNVVLLGSAFFALSLVLNAILNTQGDTRSYRNAQIGAFIANLGLDPLFMFVLELGVVGGARYCIYRVRTTGAGGAQRKARVCCIMTPCSIMPGRRRKSNRSCNSGLQQRMLARSMPVGDRYAPSIECATEKVNQGVQPGIRGMYIKRWRRVGVSSDAPHRLNI